MAEIFINAFVTVVSLGLVIVNPLTMVGVLRSKRLRDDVLTPVLISVFAGDLCLGLYNGTITSIISWMNIVDPPMWLVRLHAFYIFAPLANLMSVTLLAFLQTIAIVKPLRFSMLVTRTRVVLSLALVWTVCVVWGVCIALSNVSYFPSNRTSGSNGKLTEVTAVLTVILIIILIVSHMIIFVAVIKQQVKMRTQTGADNMAPNAFLAALRSAKRILAVTMTYMILYPTSLLTMYFLPNPMVILICFWLASTQGILNCVFYMIFSTEARKELRLLCCQ